MREGRGVGMKEAEGVGIRSVGDVAGYAFKVDLLAFKFSHFVAANSCLKLQKWNVKAC